MTVTARKRGNSWEYRFECAKIDGKRKQISKSGFKTKAEAIKEGAKAFAEYNASGIRFIPTEMSVSDYYKFWIDTYCKVNLSIETVKNYEKKIRLYIIPSIGSYKLKNITGVVLQNILNQMYENGYSRNSITVVKGLLTGGFSYAVEPAHFIKDNPTLYLKIPYHMEKENSLNKKERIAITPDVFHQILSRFPFGTTAHIPLLLAYYCGLRLGEAFAICWDDIDFEKKTLRINKQVQNADGFWRMKPPKYNSIRTISINTLLCEELKNLLALEENQRKELGSLYRELYLNEKNEIVASETDHKIFPINRKEDGSYSQPRIMAHAFRVIHHELHIEKLDYHSLRHTHASMLLEKGASPKAVQERLGHKNMKVIMEIYAHVTPSMKEQLNSVLEEL